jgi:hypothetical protein
MEPCDFDFCTDDKRSIIGEWTELHFPIGTMPIYEGDNFEDSHDRCYMNIQFDSGSPWFQIMKTVHPNGIRSVQDECVLRFRMPVQLLERIARIGRS